MVAHTGINDTSDQARRVLIEGYRKMSPARKMKCVCNLTNTVLHMAAARIKKQYGELSQRELKLHLASLWLDRQTMIKVFNWDPADKGY